MELKIALASLCTTKNTSSIADKEKEKEKKGKKQTSHLTGIKLTGSHIQIRQHRSLDIALASAQTS